MRRAKILIVEDDLILADNIKISLEKNGYDIASLAVSGEEALLFAEKENPDLVLMDIVIKSEPDGIDTADQIRKQFGIPVIFLTAYSENEIFHSTKITEPFAYITKPFDTRQLIINIEMALYKSEQDKEKEKLIQDLQKEITERKKAEEEIKRSNEFLDNIINAIDDLVYVKDEKHRFILINDKFCEQFDVTRDEVLGKCDYDYLPKEDADRFRKIEEKVFKTGETALSEDISRPNIIHGKTFVFSTKKSLLKDTLTSEKFIVGISRDITELKKAQEELLETNERYNRLTDNADEVIFRVKAEGGHVVYLNAAAERIFGYSMADWLADPAIGFKIIHPDFREKQKQIIEKINTTKKPIKNAVLSWITKDGREVIMEHTIIPILDKKENVTYFESIGRDITEFKKADEALRESEKELENIFNLTPDMICVCTPEGKFLKVSPSCEEVLGYTVDEVLKLGWTKLVHPDDVERTNKEVESQLKGNAVMNYINRFRCKDGAYKILDWRATPVIEGIVYAAARDITERKETEEQLITYQQNLRSLATELSKTEEHERHRIATYLHDQISQSLVALRINIDELKEIKDYKLISEKADHIQSMLGEILKDSRTLTFDLSPPILHELGFEPAIEWIAEKMSEDFNVPIKFESDAHPKSVERDIGLFLYRSTKECLTNIVKHAQAHSIKINIIREGDYIRITIEDDGVGFDTSILKSLTQSVGFGLFSIRERIEYIGGNLLIESESGKGTKIIMSVPLKTS